MPDDAGRLAALVAHVWVATYAPTGIDASIARYVADELDGTSAAAWIADPARRVLVAVARGVGPRRGDRASRIRLPFDRRRRLARKPPPVSSSSACTCSRPAPAAGIGRALLAAAREAARTLSADAGLWLTVNASNARALGFYRRAGFVETGVEDFALDGAAHANLVLSDVGRDSRRSRARARRATTADLPSLGAIERDAAARFSRDDLPERLRGETSGEAVLRAALAANLLWTVDGPDGAPIGFLRASPHPDAVHLDEVSVAVGHGGRGAGRALVDAFLAEARAAGHARATLTTFAHVPWNGPFYRSCGFEALAPGAAGERLEALLAAEAEAGLGGRVAMGGGARTGRSGDAAPVEWGVVSPAARANRRRDLVRVSGGGGGGGGPTASPRRVRASSSTDRPSRTARTHESSDQLGGLGPGADSDPASDPPQRSPTAASTTRRWASCRIRNVSPYTVSSGASVISVIGKRASPTSVTNTGTPERTSTPSPGAYSA